MRKFVSRHTRALRIAGATHDAIVAWVVFVVSHLVVVGPIRAFELPNFELKAILFTAASVVVFYLFSLNRGSWRYASMPDLFAIVKASMTMAIGYTIVMFVVERGLALPRSVPFLLAIFLIIGMGAPRLVYRLYRENGLQSLFPELSKSIDGNRRVVLVHTLNDAADQFIRSVRTSAADRLWIVGMVDERREKQAQQIQGVRVLGGIDELGMILDRLEARGRKVEEIVIADAQMAPARLTAIMEKAIAHGLRISRLPDIGARRELSASKILELKPINLSDLLGRKEIRIDTVGVARLIAGKTVFISGAGGSIGSELARQVASFGPRKLILADNSEFHLYKIGMEIGETHKDLEVAELILDVRDQARVDALFRAQRPEVVFHAAALKHVPIVEDNPLEGIKTNVIGTRNLADAAVASGVQTFVMISTDKAVNPTNIMGATKRAAEAYCQALDLESETTRFKTVRFGNVLGSNGSVVPRFSEQIARGGPVTVTHPDIVRFFMSIPEAVRLVLQASGHGLISPKERGRILVLDMGEPVRIDDLARKMIYLAGYKPEVDIKIVYTGLRPGEKLYEELFDNAEKVEAASGAGYATAAPRAMSRALITRTLDEMRSACAKQDAVRGLELLRHVVPEYAPAAHEPPLVARARSAQDSSSNTFDG